jgi:CheY-like chemotaxis protein
MKETDAENHASVVSSPFLVIGDSKRLQQIILNIVNNAIKFTPNGGRVELQLSVVDKQTPPDDSPSSGRSYTQIRITDTGSGISPDFLPYVFERFRQADAGLTRKQGGLGLGLAIVRHLVEMHHGYVYAHSPGVGQGATFIVELPCLEPATKVETKGKKVEVKEGSAEVSSVSDSRHCLSGLHVLVVDSDTDTREYISTVLQECGARVTSVVSVSSALLALEHSQPDILVSDIGLMDEESYTLIHKLRSLEIEKRRRIPAIALTAYFTEEDSPDASESGFHLYVSKPIEPIKLINSVAQLAQPNLTYSDSKEHS